VEVENKNDAGFVRMAALEILVVRVTMKKLENATLNIAQQVPNIHSVFFPILCQIKFLFSLGLMA